MASMGNSELAKSPVKIEFCELCRCSITGEQNIALHYIGRRHKCNVELSNSDLEPTTDLATEKHDDSKRTFDCPYCCTTLVGSSIDEHIKGRRHLANVDSYEQQKKRARCSVRVLRHPFSPYNTQEQLKDYFSRFGYVNKVTMLKTGAAFVLFNSEAHAIDALNHSHGRQWMVRASDMNESIFSRKKANELELQKQRRQKRTTDLNEQLEQLKVDCKELIEYLRQFQSSDEQLNHLREHLALPETRLEAAQNVCRRFTEILASYFPGCKVLPYGSMVSGFGTHSADLDCYCSLDEACKTREEIAQRFGNDYLASQSQQPAIKVDSKQFQPPLALDSLLDDNGAFNAPVAVEIAAAVLRSLNIVEKLRAIVAARHPIVKMHYRPPDDVEPFYIDLNFTGALSVQNTKWLRLCSQLDGRIVPYVMFIRYWAKVRLFAGSFREMGHSEGRFTNYALTLMALYALQRLSPPALPTVGELRRLCSSSETRMIDQWDASFCLDPARVPRTTNQMSVSQLVVEFFRCFSEPMESFAKNVLSLRAGSTFAADIQDPTMVHFRRAKINVQDPFELSHNVTSNVQSVVLSRFCQECASTVVACDGRKSSDFNPVSLLAVYERPHDAGRAQSRAKFDKEMTK